MRARAGAADMANVIHVETDSDDGELWVPEGAETSPPELAPLNPWRSSTMLRTHREVRARAFQRAARGPSLCWGTFDLKVLIWLVPHVAAPLAMYYIGTDLRRMCHVAAAVWQHSPPAVLLTPEGQALLLYGVLELLSLWLYVRLYASDPGWITPEAPAADADPHALPCPQCGEAPSLRSHHDKHTGCCVHKHDHHCWFLSATIGDRNHARFMCFLVVQSALLMWLQQQLLPMALRCGLLSPGPLGWLSVWGLTTPESCAAGLGVGQRAALLLLLVGGLCWLALHLHLLTLHVYLAATNQTTLELLKGPTLPYLAPAYNGQQRPGPGHSPGPAPGCRAPPGRPHEALSLLSLLRHHWRGTAPPRPFDEGLAANLWTFFLAPKPHTYRYSERFVARQGDAPRYI